SIRGIIAARLDAIPPMERSVLLDASVVGRIFWNGALAQLGPHGESLSDALDFLEGRDLIRREPVSRFQGQQQFRFKHAVIREEDGEQRRRLRLKLAVAQQMLYHLPDAQRMLQARREREVSP